MKTFAIITLILAGCAAPQQPACRYCGSADQRTDIDGLARVVRCLNCDTTVPISIWETANKQEP